MPFPSDPRLPCGSEGPIPARPWEASVWQRQEALALSPVHVAAQWTDSAHLLVLTLHSLFRIRRGDRGIAAKSEKRRVQGSITNLTTAQIAAARDFFEPSLCNDMPGREM